MKKLLLILVTMSIPYCIYAQDWERNHLAEEEIFQAINKIRNDADLSVLQRGDADISSVLDSATLLCAEEMKLLLNEFNHQNIKARENYIKEEMNKLEYSFYFMGEIAAYKYVHSTMNAVETWMASEEHMKNITHPYITHTGIVVLQKNNMLISTQIFVGIKQ